MITSNAKHISTLLKTAALAGLIALTSGCASMSKSDCEKVDYYKMGIEHGEDGEGNGEYTKIAGKCQAMGTTPNEQNYNNGRTVGLAKFCTENRGSNDAEKGAMNGNCLEVPPYKNAYNAELGKRKEKEAAKLRDLEKAQGKNQQQIDKTRSELNKIDEAQKSTPAQ